MSTVDIELKLWSDSVRPRDAEATLPSPLHDERHSAAKFQPRSGKWIMILPLLLIAIIGAILAVGGWEPSLRFQPSVVGMLWAGTFLAGYLVGSLGHGRLWAGGVAVAAGWSNQAAFEQLTELGTADTLLLSAILLLAGWVIATFDPMARPAVVLSLVFGRSERPKHSPRVGGWRWSIWELGFVTAIAACVAHAGPRLNSPRELLWAVVAAMLAGLTVSWLACRWVWKDDWSLVGLVGLTLALAASLAVLILSAPSGQSLGHWLKWLLCGPVNVVAAQGLCVLATMGVWRQCLPSLPGLPRV